MKCTSTISLALISLLTLAPIAAAEPSSGNNGGRQGTAPQHQSWEAKRELYHKLHKKFHKPKPIPIDPGRGDGKPLDPPHATPQGPPGFIWVHDHWERAKAPQGSPPQTPNVVIRDHRKPTAGTVIVRDHRKPDTVVVRDHRTTGGVVVRDHRTTTPASGWQLPPQDTSSNSGGVTVTTTPTKNQGAQIRDHRKR